jgi:hypothetical protein
MKFIINNIRILLLFILLFLSVFTYHPTIQNTGDFEGGSILSPYIMVLFAVLFLLTFSMNNILKSKVILLCLSLTLLFSLTLSFIFVCGYEIEILAFVRPLLMATAAIMIGWNLKIFDKSIKYLLLFFAGMALFVAISQVVINIGGLIIENQHKVDGKNMLGCVTAATAVLSCIFVFTKDSSKISIILYLAITVAAIICLLTMRARTASLITLLLIVFVIFKKNSTQNRKFVLSVFGTILIFVLIYIILPEGAKKYIFDSFMQGKEGDITSDRTYRNSQAISFLNDNLLIGNIEGKSNVAWVHNFPLLQAYNFGIIGAFGVLLLYFYLLFNIIKSVFKYDIFNIRNIGFMLLAVSFGISMAEPSFPFGPGTVNVFNFIMFGVALKYNYEQKKSKIENYE